MSAQITIKAPTKPFFSLCSSQQRHKVSVVKKAIEIVSDGKYCDFFKHLCTHTQFGKEFILPAAQNTKLDPIITSIKDLHQKALAKDKPALLSLVAKHYTHTQLLNIGFNISKHQLSRARNIDDSNSASIGSYTRTMPPSRKKNFSFQT